MVRLKEETKRQRRVRAIIFQFHYGTIKSEVMKHHASSTSYFNSTMVRLKEEHGAGLYNELIYFNSTMVRLKAIH